MIGATASSAMTSGNATTRLRRRPNSALTNGARSLQRCHSGLGKSRPGDEVAARKVKNSAIDPTPKWHYGVPEQTPRKCYIASMPFAEFDLQAPFQPAGDQ